MLTADVRERERDRAAVMGLHVGEEADVDVVEGRVGRASDPPADDTGEEAERDDERDHLPTARPHDVSFGPSRAPLASPRRAHRRECARAPSGPRTLRVSGRHSPRGRSRGGRARSRRGRERRSGRDSTPGRNGPNSRPRSPVSPPKSPYSLGILAQFDCRRRPTRLGRRGRKPTFFLGLSRAEVTRR